MTWVALREPNKDLPLQEGVYADCNGLDDTIIVIVSQDWLTVIGPNQGLCRIILDKLPDIYPRWTELKTSLDQVAQQIGLTDLKPLIKLTQSPTTEITDDHLTPLSPAS